MELCHSHLIVCILNYCYVINTTYISSFSSILQYSSLMVIKRYSMDYKTITNKTIHYLIHIFHLTWLIFILLHFYKSNNSHLLIRISHSISFTFQSTTSIDPPPTLLLNLLSVFVAKQIIVISNS